MKNKFIRGLSLIELVLYIGIFIVVVGVFTAYLTGTLKLSNRESANSELSAQLNSAMQTIGQKIQSASNIEIEAGVPVSSLKLRMKDPLKDPTCVSLSGTKIILAEGPAVGAPQNCTSVTSDLTTGKVNVTALTFLKQTFYPGQDQVIIDLQMIYNSTNPEQQISRAIRTAVNQMHAATFSDNLLPGSGFFNLGSATSPWQNGYFSGRVGIRSTNPGASLEVVPPADNADKAIRIKNLSGNGSVDLFVTIGDSTFRTGTTLCRTLASNAVCLAYWASTGAASTCASSITNGRALCSDFGD